jgi:archaellum component FlaC
MKKVLLLLLFFSLGQSFAQSKKEQIAVLQFQLDSLSSKLTLERNLNSQNKELLNAQITSLKEEINGLLTQKKELNGVLEKKEADLEGVSKRLENSTKEVGDLKNNYDSLSVAYTTLSQESVAYYTQLQKASADRDNQLVRLFVEKFYRSLEPSPETYDYSIFNPQSFDLDPFYALLDLNAVYSKQRITSLNGEGHEYIKMSLVSIDDIKITNQVAEVIASVEYKMYEFQGFINQEKLIINLASPTLGLLRWEDVRLKKIDNYRPDMDENWTEKDFYKSMGSINK